MSQPCAVDKCGRSSRALCHCCQQNLCRDHLIEHDDLLNSRLNPIADEVNQLNDKLNHLDINNLLVNAHEQLEKWRQEGYRKIDEFVNEKQRVLHESISSKVTKISEEITQLKTCVGQLIKKQDTTVEDLRNLSSIINTVRQEIGKLEYKYVGLNVKSLEIDKKIVQIEEDEIKHAFNLRNLLPSVHVINRTQESPKPIASNTKFLLMHMNNQLCLLNDDLVTFRAIPWVCTWIWDMCWSSTLKRFFIITLNDIYILDEEFMQLQCLPTKDRYSYCACTCSEKSFYVTTNVLGSSICEFSLTPEFQLVKRWEPAGLCQKDEMIQDIVYHCGTLGFIVVNQTVHRKRMELRSIQKFELIWCIQFDAIDPLHDAFRLCLFNCDEWLVTDWKTSTIFHITNDGQIKSSFIYDEIPYRCCQFGPNFLAISAKASISFHSMQDPL